jgi:hypothetical protein
MVRQWVLIICVLLPGTVITGVSAHYLFNDWSALAGAFTRFETAVGRHDSFNAISIANAYQEMYRINCFADGVGALGGLIIFSIGMVGLCLNRREPPANQE